MDSVAAADTLVWGGGEGLRRILHVSGDFPDPFETDKTRVIQRFVDLTAAQFAHRVLSINRVAPGLDLSGLSSLGAGKLEVEREPFPYGEAWQYRAPPLVVWHKRRLLELGNRLAERLRCEPPQLLMAHKLTIEGIVVAQAAQRLGLPYSILIQGNTDAKILAARPDLRRHLRRIFHGANVVISLAPWSLEAMKERLGSREGPTFVVPAPTDLDQPVPPRSGGKNFVSLFHLRHRRVKNLYGLLEATRILRKEKIDHRLDIIGGGDAPTLARCERMAASVGDVHFVGPQGRSDVAQRLNSATAMVLPSRRESFGLAFVEALFAGTPIIYPSGVAVDGYFDDLPFALRIDPRDPASIARAMRHALENESALKSELASWQMSKEAQRFQRDTIAAQFASALNQSFEVA